MNNDDKNTFNLSFFTLSFNNNEIDKNYKEFQKPLTEKSHIFSGLIMTFIYLVVGTINILQQLQEIYISIILYMLGIFMFALVMLLYKKTYNQDIKCKLIQINIFIFNILMIELKIKHQFDNYINKEELAFVLFSCIPCFIFLSHAFHRWYTKEIYLLITGEYLIFRLLDYKAIFVPLYHLILLLFLFAYYDGEKTKKLLFLNLWKNHIKQDRWKFLVNHTAPIPIFVVKKQQKQTEKIYNDEKTTNASKLLITIANQKCKQIFQIKNEEEMIKIIDNILIDKDNLEESLKQLQSEHKPKKSNQLVVSQLKENENLKINLANILIQKLNNCKINDLYCNSQVFKEETYVNCNYQDSSTLFDLKLIDFIWDDELSVMIIANIVSEKVKQDRQKKIQSYKRKMFQTITHNLKTPLNCIVLLAQAGQNIIKQEESVQKYFSQILINSSLLIHQINDILDYSKLQQNLLVLDISTFSLKNALIECLELYQEQAKQKNIQLDIILDNINQDIQITNDINRLKQLLNNLIGNSIKFTFKGRVIIKIQKVSQSQSLIQEQIINISIIDTGIGIDTEQLKLLKLQCQDQNHLSISVNHSHQHGVGLGLEIASQIINYLGPQNQLLNIKSEIGIGTEISFNIYKNLLFDKKRNISQSFRFNSNSFFSQLNKQQSEVDIEIENCNNEDVIMNQIKIEKDVCSISLINQKSISSVDLINKQKLISYHDIYIQQLLNIFQKETKILVVDDTMYNIMAIKCLFFPVKNLIIQEAYNGEQAIEILKKNQKEYIAQQDQLIKLVMMDINMPVMDGLQATKKIRRLENCKQLQKLLIFAVTAFTDEFDSKQAQLSGVDEYLHKPIVLPSLISLLTKYQNQLQ